MGRNIVLIDPNIPEEELKHYGVPGMRWGKRKGIVGTGAKGKVTKWDKKKYDMKERQTKLKAKGKIEKAKKIGKKINKIERRNKSYLRRAEKPSVDDKYMYGPNASKKLRKAASRGSNVDFDEIKRGIGILTATYGVIALSDPGIRRAATNGAKKILGSAAGGIAKAASPIADIAKNNSASAVFANLGKGASLVKTMTDGNRI